MNDADNDIDIEDVQQAQAQNEREQQQQQQQAVFLLRKMILVLEHKEIFPSRSRNKTDELVVQFLEELGDDVHEMLCDNHANGGSDNYYGLDSDRDTEEEVEAIVGFFPEVLHRKGGNYNLYPIQCSTFFHNKHGNWQCNEKAVLFIPILARLAIKFTLFEEDERGGLLCDYGKNGLDNALHSLMASDNTELHNQEHNESIDTKYLQVLIQFRKLGLLNQNDIRWYDLLHKLCEGEDYFAEKRFRFLVEWDPSALTLITNEDGYLPIHCAAEDSSIKGLELVFEYGIRYFPKKEGISLIFRKNTEGFWGETPFQYACKKFGYEQVIKVVEETLIRCYSSSSSDDTPPLNVVEAFLSAAIEENIHLDCLYFLLRREPDLIQKLLSFTTPAAVAAMDSNNNIGHEKNNGINDGENDDNLSQTRSNPKKRKRKRKENIMNDDDNN
ncbi:hypothetical protein FRACYDRAFT_266188 [Fragilariopsis cylindrus CCMP1102]|uniref:Ankyrin n=1 Tax=Fragilariopsis cylindrus CCMP1102 TaxID=635003 RepID=A0A1E7EK35_9STRA|nr:hypothetical protein FRACYDRAFT_266188 [Fragilariopsis cylindrus CCMP1102]|eukprot:OEU06238.1 hypothetical protein FRACYDRAFT_266188 [Fragilariopsis cylindrus CCMP1102]